MAARLGSLRSHWRGQMAGGRPDRVTRHRRAGISVVLCAAVAGLTAAALPAVGAVPRTAAIPASGTGGTWAATGSMNVPRINAMTALFRSGPLRGKVLVAGGGNGSGDLSSAELYNPATGNWSATGAMSQIRATGQAQLLGNGKVLVEGGDVPSGAMASAELYNPRTGRWATTGSMRTPRWGFVSAVLPNGKVLVAGGHSNSAYLSSAELYNPTAGTWSATGSMHSARYLARATLLPDGQVLVAGGDDASGTLATAELYNPATGRWTTTGSMLQARAEFGSILLGNGKVLVLGGDNSSYGNLATAELYNPGTGRFANTGSMITARNGYNSVLLPDGDVLVAGDSYFLPDSPFRATTNLAELYNPATGTWSATASMSQGRASNAMVLLLNGQVLLAGGYETPDSSTGYTYLASAVSYRAPGPPAAWRAIFSDHFAGRRGSGPGPKWTYDIGTGYHGTSCPASWGTNEVESSTRSTANIRLDGHGHLVIRPVKASGSWTSGRIETVASNFAAPVGGELRITTSIDQPAPSKGRGYWPAFWMLGAGFRARGAGTSGTMNCAKWPSVGEIDIMEDVNALSQHSGTLHCGTAPGGPCNESTGLGSGLRPCKGCQSGYHTYTVIVNRTNPGNESITWYLDNRAYLTVTESQVGATAWKAAVDHGFFLILDVAMGGAYPNAICDCTTPTAATSSGAAMGVKYVTVSVR